VKNCNPSVYFDFNSTRLDEQSKYGLDWVGKKLSKRTNSKVIVTGYADKVGEDGVNMDISKERADVVKKYLVEEHHIDPSRVEIAFKGNRSASSEPENQYLERRVEVTFAKKDDAWYDDTYNYLDEKFSYLFE